MAHAPSPTWVCGPWGLLIARRPCPQGDSAVCTGFGSCTVSIFSCPASALGLGRPSSCHRDILTLTLLWHRFFDIDMPSAARNEYMAWWIMKVTLRNFANQLSLTRGDGGRSCLSSLEPDSITDNLQHYKKSWNFKLMVWTPSR